MQDFRQGTDGCERSFEFMCNRGNKIVFEFVQFGETFIDPFQLCGGFFQFLAVAMA